MAGLTIVLGLFFQFHHRCQQVFHKSYLLPGVANRAGGGGGDFGTPDGSAPNAITTPTLSGGTPGIGPGQAASVTGGTAAGGDEGPIFFSEPFEVRDHENVEIRIRSTGTNFWLGIDGDLVDEQSGVVQEFSLPIEYYEGVSDGEAWSEGSRQASAFLSALPAGHYTLRIAGQHEPPNIPLCFEVSVYENVARTQHLLLALAAVSLLPGIVLLQDVFAYLRTRQ